MFCLCYPKDDSEIERTGIPTKNSFYENNTVATTKV